MDVDFSDPEWELSPKDALNKSVLFAKNNSSKVFNGEAFDSRLEAGRCLFLMWAQNKSYISDLEFHVKLKLLPSMVYFGKKLRGTIYTPDAYYIYNEIEWWEEIKGYPDAKFIMRFRYAKHFHSDKRFVIWRGGKDDFIFPTETDVHRPVNGSSRKSYKK